MYSKVLMILTVTSLGLFLLFNAADVEGRGCRGGRFFHRGGGCGARAVFHRGGGARGGCASGSCAIAEESKPPVYVSTGCACSATGECSCGDGCQCGVATKHEHK